MAKSMKDVTYGALGEAFNAELPPDELPIIDDMLAWQKMIDEAPMSINMRGTARLFKTISHYIGRDIYVNESPDPTEITIPLTDTVGIQIKAEANSVFDSQPEPGEPSEYWVGDLSIRFVSLESKEWFTA